MQSLWCIAFTQYTLHFVYHSLLSRAHKKSKQKKREEKHSNNQTLSLFAHTKRHPAITRANPADLTQILTQASRCERAVGLLHHCIKLHMLPYWGILTWPWRQSRQSASLFSSVPISLWVSLCRIIFISVSKFLKKCNLVENVTLS